MSRGQGDGRMQLDEDVDARFTRDLPRLVGLLDTRVKGGSCSGFYKGTQYCPQNSEQPQ